MKFTVDSSVFIAALIGSEPNHKIAANFFGKVQRDRDSLVLPSTIPLEVTNIVCRKMTKQNQAAAPFLKRIFFSSKSIQIHDIHMQLFDAFVQYASVLQLKTADALIAVFSHREGTSLISLDKRLVKQAKHIAPAYLPQELVSSFK